MKIVPITLLLVLALSACGPSADLEVHADLVKTTQNHYATVDECRKDWGTDPQDCQPAPANHMHGGGFVSPVYIWGPGMSQPHAVASDGTSRALSNSYLARGAQPVAGAKAMTSSLSVPKNSAVSSLAQKSGAVLPRNFIGSNVKPANPTPNAKPAPTASPKPSVSPRRSSFRPSRSFRIGRRR
jgi:hypothetical protein